MNANGIRCDVQMNDCCQKECMAMMECKGAQTKGKESEEEKRDMKMRLLDDDEMRWKRMSGMKEERPVF